MTNPCNWPNHCSPETAQDMLEAIRQAASTAHGCMEIEDALLDRIIQAIDRCLLPDLTKNKKHVCFLENPRPCDELQLIRAHADKKAFPEDPTGQPASPAGHWVTIAQELESFPNGQ